MEQMKPNNEQSLEIIRTKAENVAKEIAGNIHQFSNELIAEYNEKHPEDLFNVDSEQEFMESAKGFANEEENEITITSKGAIKAVLERKGTEWTVKEFTIDPLFIPEEISKVYIEKIKDLKNIIAEKFN